jgi:2-keto-4-pentenoate hydratase
MGLSTVAWASMYDDTVHHAATNDMSISVGRMFSPKIEPEIMMKLKAPLGADVAQPLPRAKPTSVARSRPSSGSRWASK